MLNKEQQKAVSYRGGPLCMVAGPGSGKTRVVVEKIKSLLEENISPSQILCFSFTNKASNELKERIFDETNINMKESISTIHSFCYRIIKSHLKLNGESISSYKILNSDEENKLISLIISKQIKDVKKRSSIKSSIQKANLDYIFYKLVLSDKKYNDVRKILREIQAYKSNHRLISFSDLENKAFKYLRGNKSFRKEWSEKFDYIFVDEFQDVSFRQFEILKMITNKKSNINVVGDSDQSIYSWRGASSKVIESFIKYYSNVKIINLNQTYRSSKEIILFVNWMIKKNKSLLKRELWTENANGNKPEILEFNTNIDETNKIINKINDMKNGDEKIAILYRNNSLSRMIEFFLISKNIFYLKEGELLYKDKFFIKFIDALVNLRSKGNLHELINLTRNPNKLQDKLKIVNFQIKFYCKLLSIDDVKKNIDTWLENIQINIKQFSRDGNKSNVLLGTIHSSKGMEYDHVFMPYSDNKIFDSVLEKEEECRLFFVGITRARKTLTLSYSNELISFIN